MPSMVSAPLCGAARQVWSQQCHRCLVRVMMWLCRSYGRKLYPIGVGVSNDDVNWASFPSVEVFVVRLSAMSMVLQVKTLIRLAGWAAMASSTLCPSWRHRLGSPLA
ncbi:hypothetical protein SETIT_2G046500v2 [Setaria italica]|uniref:Uncharacterized protein n=1 Tax=Setaria italica TaxID=4555 RepID=A0A368PVU8_SETIT|nr:hypothetical protein SETIT_2G046500v2 [Setaria italica]